MPGTAVAVMVSPVALAGGGGVRYLLRDEFTTDRSAGAVDGTLAEPGPGTRTVVDTENKISISADKLTFAGGKASPGWGDPATYYEQITRTPGRLLIASFVPAGSGAGGSDIGFDTDKTSTNLNGLNVVANNLRFASIVLGTVAGGTTYKYAVALVAAGFLGFIKGGAFPNWTYLGWWRTTDRTATLYPGLTTYNEAFTVDFIRIPDTLWLPTPLLSDGFGSAFGMSDGLGHAEGVAGGIGAGGSGVTLSNAGGTWSVSGGKAINTPSVGAELLTNGNMETGDPPTGWTAVNATLDGVADERTGGAGVQSLEVTATSSSARAERAITLEANQFYKISGWCKRTGGTVIRFSVARASDSVREVSLDASNSAWAFVSASLFVSTASCKAFCEVLTSGGVGTFDDVSVRKLELTELLTLSNLSCADVYIGSSMVTSPQAYEMVGVALNWDSAISPANGLIVSCVSGYLMIFKCLAGVWSRITYASFTYAAGARLVCTMNAGALRVYYNGALITTATIADAGILTGQFHGLFSTDASSTLDDLTAYAIGTGGEYSQLDSY